jgi:hypothetical protein
MVAPGQAGATIGRREGSAPQSSARLQQQAVAVVEFDVGPEPLRESDVHPAKTVFSGVDRDSSHRPSRVEGSDGVPRLMVCRADKLSRRAHACRCHWLRLRCARGTSGVCPGSGGEGTLFEPSRTAERAVDHP